MGVGLTFAFTAALSVASALAFRFPVPFLAYVGPFGDASLSGPGELALSALAAWLFYSVIGGAVPQLGYGLVVGLVLGDRYAASPHKTRVVAFAAFVGALLMVSSLATLDWIIGPW